MGVHASVQDHLSARGPSPDWVVSLAEMIQLIQGSSAAISSSRAKDLSRVPIIGEALESIVRGYQVILNSDIHQLSPMQRETIEELVLTILNDLQNKIENPGGSNND